MPRTTPSETWADATWALETEPPAPVAAPDLLDERVTDEARDRYADGLTLGEGGMGRVVLVEDRHLHRHVARKELRVATPALAARFLREARITAQLQHPGIVPIHELGRRADGTLYYTMSRVRGRTLGEALAAARTVEDRLALLGPYVEVCHAVAYAHSKGVVHRDLKPDNVMIGPFGETILLDWGLAKVAGEDDPFADLPDDDARAVISGDSHRTRVGAVLGTPRYMSPEQARGDEIDARSDVWSLGAVLYEILSGSTPFEGATAIVLSHARESVVEPPVPPRGTPAELVAIAMKALERLPEDRYPSASALAADVEAFRTGAVVSAHDYTALDQVRRVALRGRAALALGAVAMLAAALTWGLSAGRLAAEQAARDGAVARAETAEALVGALEAERQGHRERALAMALALPDQAMRERLVAGGADARVLSASPASRPTWSSSGARLAWAEGAVVRIGDPASGVELGRVQVSAPVTALAFTSADDGVLIGARDGTVTRLAFLDGRHEKIAELGAAPERLVALDRTRVGVALPGREVVVDARTGDAVPGPELPAPPPAPELDAAQVLTASGDTAARPDGVEVAVAGPDGVRVWRILRPGDPVPEPQTNLRRCPDGRVVPVLPYPPVGQVSAPAESCS